MKPSRNVVHRSYVVFAIAILLLLLGGLGLYVGSHNYVVRALGLIAVIASAHLIRISHFRNPSGLAEASARTNPKIAKGPGRLLWIMSLAFVPLLAASLFLLHVGAESGGHAAWPADIFAGVAPASAIVWSLLIAKILSGRASGNQF